MGVLDVAVGASVDVDVDVHEGVSYAGEGRGGREARAEERHGPPEVYALLKLAMPF